MNGTPLAAPLAAPASPPEKYLPIVAAYEHLAEGEGEVWQGTPTKVNSVLSHFCDYRLPELIGRSQHVWIERHADGMLLSASAVVESVEKQFGSQGRPKADKINYEQPPRGWRIVGKREPRYQFILRISPDQRSAATKCEEVDEWTRVTRVGESSKGTRYWRQTNRPNSDEHDWTGFYDPRRVFTYLKVERSAEWADHMMVEAEANFFRERLVPFTPKWDTVARTYNPGPELRCQPIKGRYPTWQRLFKRLFADLAKPLKVHPWAVANKVTPERYGFFWLAYMVQHPAMSSPYLFLYGDTDCGKSILHEAINDCLFETTSADMHLNGDKFNKHLMSSVLAYIEEVSLSKAKGAGDKIKFLVTANRLPVRGMYQDQIETDSYLHFVQCSNRRDALPIAWGDTRAVCLSIPPLVKMTSAQAVELAAGFADVEALPLDQQCAAGAKLLAALPANLMIPKPTLLRQLKAEAPHLLYALQNETLPDPICRLAIPPVTTDLKETIMLADVPESVVEIVSWVLGAKASKWSGTAGELSKLCRGRVDTDRRKLMGAANSESGRQYLADHGVTISFPQTYVEKGALIDVCRAK